MRAFGVEAIWRIAFDDSVVVSWEELTSSKLPAQSYEEAGEHILIPYPLSLIPKTIFPFTFSLVPSNIGCNTFVYLILGGFFYGTD